MKKIMYPCDRCGKEIEHPEELRAIYTHPNYSEEDHVREESILNDMGFCPECIEDIKTFAKKPLSAAPLFMLDVTKAVKMPDNMVQFWKSKLAEAKVQE